MNYRKSKKSTKVYKNSEMNKKKYYLITGNRKSEKK